MPRRSRPKPRRPGRSPEVNRAVWPEDGLCPLCGREMILGPTLNDHHLIPKMFGGVIKHVMHKVCHSKIHSVLSESELATRYHTFEALRSHPDLAKFIRWIRKREPAFMTAHRRPHARTARRL